MAETVKGFAFNVTVPLAAAAVLQLTGPQKADVSLANLPQPQGAGQNTPGARAVRIRGTLNLLGAPGGVVTISVNQGQTVGGTQVNAQPASVTSGTPVAHQAIPFEVIDTAPPTPLQYNINLVTAVSTTTANITAELEVIE